MFVIKLSPLEDLKDYCLKAIRGEFETSKIEIKGFLDIDNVFSRWQFIRSIAAIANTPPDPVIPYGLLIAGVRNGQILNNFSQWVKDDNEYQNLIKNYCDPMINFSFYRLEHQGKSFGVFVVPNSQQRPHVIVRDLVQDDRILLAKGQIYVREGSETRVALKREIQRYIIDDFSYRINKSLDELSTKDSQIANVRFLPESAPVSLEIVGKIKEHLWENIAKVRQILRGLS